MTDLQKAYDKAMRELMRNPALTLKQCSEMALDRATEETHSQKG